MGFPEFPQVTMEQEGTASDGRDPDSGTGRMYCGGDPWEYPVGVP